MQYANVLQIVRYIILYKDGTRVPLDITIKIVVFIYFLICLVHNDNQK